MKKHDTPPTKAAYCKFDPSLSFEGAVGGLRIFIPAEEGYVNYNFIHSVVEDRRCDTWRLGKAFAFDGGLTESVEVTPDGAEWDMAVRLSGRPDFIGGFAHGDESYTSLEVYLDGVAVDMAGIRDLTAFGELTLTVESVGYDPSDPPTPVLKHFKKYLINGDGITLCQRVEWLGEYEVGSSYLAMMPPLKTLTDRFFTDADPEPKEPTSSYGLTAGAHRAAVYGRESGFAFLMSVPRWPSLRGGDCFRLTDNRGGRYNKMYFVICDGEQVQLGDVWETVTEYRILRGAPGSFENENI